LGVNFDSALGEQDRISYLLGLAMDQDNFLLSTPLSDSRRPAKRSPGQSASVAC